MINKYLNLATLSLLAMSSELPTEAGPVGIVPGRLLVKSKPGFSVADAVRPFSGKEIGGMADLGIAIVNVPEHAFEHALRGLQRNPNIEFAEPDVILEPGASPNDPYFDSQWHLAKIQAPLAWDVTQGSSGVIIAILDTGVDGTHPDLAAKLVPGWNTYDNNSNSSDVFGHGTAVAGTAAALSDNGQGVAGVAWNSPIMPVRISDASGYGYYSTIASGLNWAANHGAKVANISYAVTGSSSVRSAAQYFQSKGGIVVASAGNDALFDSAPDNPYIITVSATSSSDSLPSWSNTGNSIDVSAPGLSIYTTARGGGYVRKSGTSFSAPITAGVAALVLAAQPNLSSAQVTQILKDSSDDIGTAGFDSNFGYGRVNAWKAVAMAGNTVATPPPIVETSTPAPLDTVAPTVSITSPAPGTMSGMSLSVSVLANDDRAVTLVQLYVDGKLEAATTRAPFTNKWNAKKASKGAHNLQTIAYDAAGNAGVSQVVTIYK
jgi:thermitase